MTAIHHLSAMELASAIRNRRIGSLEATYHFIDRIQAERERLNAIVVEDFDRALRAAREADHALSHGVEPRPLHGVPMTVKEQFDVEGLRTTLGLPHLADAPFATRDDAIVSSLRTAGAVILGKSNVPPGLSDHQTFNPIYGLTRNPWDPNLTAGGSSGGSAVAVAAGLSACEVGSDIGGSLRVPAAFCGVFSHKPTWGLLPSHALGCARPGDFSTPGPMARRATDLAPMLHVLLQRDGALRDLPSLPSPVPRTLAQYRVAVWADDSRAPVQADISSAIEQFALELERVGAMVNHSARPAADAIECARLGQTLMWAELAGAMPPEMVDGYATKASRFDPEDWSLEACRARGLALTHWQFLQLEERRMQLRAAWNRFFDDYDVLLAPVHISTAFPHDTSEPFSDRSLQVEGRVRPQWDSFFWIMQGHAFYLPATTMPIGLDRSGRPIGIQVITRERHDLMSIRFSELAACLCPELQPPLTKGAPA